MSDLSFSALKACTKLADSRFREELLGRLNETMAELTGARASALLGFSESGSRIVALAGNHDTVLEPVDTSDAQWPEHPFNYLFSTRKALWEENGHSQLIEARSLLFGIEAFGRLMVVPGRTRDSGYADLVHVLLVPSNIRPTRRTFSILTVFAGNGAILLDGLSPRLENAAFPVPVPRAADVRKATKDGRFSHWDQIIGTSAPAQQLRAEIEHFAPTNLNILVTGETGTGKELVARALHEHSLCHTGPFVAVNTTTLPSQLIESELFGHVKGAFTGANEDRIGLIAKAHGGTLFLDEIGDLPYELQAKLLRVLQEHRFRPVGSEREIHSEFRLISATHRDLAVKVEKGEFRQDLYFRINQAPIHIAPLRERGQDILLLAEHFLDRQAERLNQPAKILQPQTRRQLLDRPYLGNVRELMALVQRAAAAAGEGFFIHPDHLVAGGRSSPIAEIPAGMTLPQFLASCERTVLTQALQASNGNRRHCAEKLGVPLRTLAHKLDRHGL